MKTLPEILQQYGIEKQLQPEEVLIRQGTMSDGIYFLKQGELGVYREEQDQAYLLSRVAPGGLVGELAAATGQARTATVLAEEISQVIHVPETHFRRALSEVPGLAAEIIHLMVGRLTDADVARVTLGRSYRQAVDRVQALGTEKAQLEELLRLREELADMIVHDLRNPLGVISGGMDLLDHSIRELDTSGYASSVLEMMERAVKRMQRLVETLLDIARLEEGEMILQIIPLDLNAAVEEIIAEEQHFADTCGVGLENRIPADLPSISADRDVFQRVLINLLDNSIKFTPRNGLVWIEAHVTEQEIRIEVVDTGLGIPLEERERIFEKFTQVKGRTGARRGSGLGLAFCRMATEAHGGRIWVEDGPSGKGSRFALTLPLNKPAE